MKKALGKAAVYAYYAYMMEYYNSSLEYLDYIGGYKGYINERIDHMNRLLEIYEKGRCTVDEFLAGIMNYKCGEG